MFRLLMLILGLSLAGSVAAQESVEIRQLRAEIEAILKETRTPAASVAVIRDSRIEWAAGLGTAEVATGRKADADTLFRIGSVSKGLVALAALKLQEEGRLDLNAPLASLAPELPCKNPWETTDPVRFVHLLEHTAGWHDAPLRAFAWDPPEEVTMAECVELTRSARVARWKPGTRYAYSNVGPAMAAYVIEKLTGERFEDYIHRTWLVPLGMADASYFGTPEVRQRSAVGYHRDGGAPYPYWKIAMRPAGSLNVSPRAMANYVLFHVQRGLRNGVALLSEASMQRMETPTTTYAARQGLRAGYGLGNYASVQDGWLYHGHEGDALGSRTEMNYLPDAGVGYAFTINSDDGGAFSRVSHALQTYVTRSLVKPAPVAAVPLPAGVEKYAGWYEPINPRIALYRGFERWNGSMLLRVEGDALEMTHFSNPTRVLRYVHCGGQLLRGADEPVPTLALLRDSAEGTLIQEGAYGTTWRRVPLAALRVRIALAIATLLVLATVPVVAAVWLFRRALGRPVPGPTLRLRLFPLLAVLALVGMVGFYFGALDIRPAIARFGRLTPWSGGLFLCSVLVPLGALGGLVEVWRLRRQPINRGLWWYSLVASLAAALASAYLAECGLLAVRTWV